MAEQRERLKGGKCHHKTMEFGEKVHFQKNTSGNEVLEVNFCEGFFQRMLWRPSEAAIGTEDGLLRVGTVLIVESDHICGRIEKLSRRYGGLLGS